MASLADECKWFHHKTGDEIVGYLNESSDVYFVLSGHARVRIYSLVGKVVGFRNLAPGDFFGEFAAIDDGPRSASIEADSDCLVAVLPALKFRKTLEEQPRLSHALMVHFVNQLRMMTARVLDISTLKVNTRVERELLRLAQSSSKPSGRTEEAIISPMPTHAEIASRISTHREAVSRHLSDLARIGLIERKGRAVVIKNLPQLRLMVREATGEQ